jgi:hypothetical protein
MSLQSALHTLTFSIAAALLMVNAARAQPAVSVPASGYELSIGHDCVVSGVPATCGTTFTGWTGETSTGEWLKLPGTGQGTWLVLINYTGQPMFNGLVNVVGGSWLFILKNGGILGGTVTSGLVAWPIDANSSNGCGNGVAVINANLSVSHGKAATLTGCLHDLPKGSVIPPKVWGTFLF